MIHLSRSSFSQKHLARAVALSIVGGALVTGASTPALAEKSEDFWTVKKRTTKATSTRSRLVPLSGTCEATAAPYLAARKAYNEKANRYWGEITRKRKIRRDRKRKKLALRRVDYVLSHPPAYSGPARPKCLNALDKAKPKQPTKKRSLPVVSDFLSAARKLYGFRPRATNEWNYKRTFAREALAVGLTANQVVGVYALETGGIGPYYRQSGIFPVDSKCRPLKKNRGRAASTALSYAQLLAANTSIMARELGATFAGRLERQARTASAARAAALRSKAKVLRKMSRDVAAGLKRYKGQSPWNQYRAFAKTERGYAVHALLLDADIGPLLQVHKLKKIVAGAKARGFRNVSAAQLELMNLAGPGTGLEMMTPLGAKMPTANFFSRGGHDRNPVVKNRSGKGLLNKLADRISAQMVQCGSKEFLAAFRAVSG